MNITDLKIQGYEDKVVASIKDNIQMTVFGGKLSVCNLLQISLKDKEDETNSFFGSLSGKDDSIDLILPINFDYTDRKVILHYNDYQADNNPVELNIDSYPEEMQEAISKSISGNKSYFSKTKLKTITNTVGLEDLISDKKDVLAKAYDSLMADIKKFKTAGSSDDAEGFIERYMFKKHILIQGKKGGGKTYAVDKKLHEDGIAYLELDGNEGIESTDLLGYYIKDSSGNFVWLDGVLSQAFRLAQTQKIVLFIDEILRIPKRELNILVGALTPMSDGTYTLRNNRITNTSEGIGETEFFKVPMENLWCVGTTNVGAGYAVDEIDEALSDRFRIMVNVMSESKMEHIIENQLKKKGFTNALAPKFMTFYKQMSDLVSSGELERDMNLRHICETIQIMDTEADVKTYLFDLIPNWVTQETNGSLSKPEIELITKLIKRIF